MSDSKSSPGGAPDRGEAQAVGDILSGLFVVCAEDPATSLVEGFLGSWIQQVSFDPLMISLAIKPGRPAHDLIVGGGVFSVNVIGEENQRLRKILWNGYDPLFSPFKTVQSTRGAAGGVLLDEARSSMECRRHSMITPGDHRVVFAEVLGGVVRESETRPLVHMRKSGHKY